MRWARLVLALGIAFGLAGCGEEEKRAAPCPNFLLLGHAGNMTKFRDGPGRDVTDVEFRARIVNFLGSCDHTDSGIEAELFVEVAVQRGPANRSREASFEYFVAIPKFLPAPAGKKTLPVTVKFEENKSRLVYRDQVLIEIPLGDKDVAANYDVYLGFQVSAEQLEFNRRRRAR